MAGGKDRYTVGRSATNPGKWAIFRNGVEIKNYGSYETKAQASGKALRLNTDDHGRPK